MTVGAGCLYTQPKLFGRVVTKGSNTMNRCVARIITVIQILICAACQAQVAATTIPTVTREIAAFTPTPISATITAQPTQETPTLEPILTRTPTLPATAILPPQTPWPLPSGLSVEEFPLQALPQSNPFLTFEPLDESAEAVLERHRMQRQKLLPPLIEISDNLTLSFAIQGDAKLTAKATVTNTEQGQQEWLDVLQGEQVIYTVPLEHRGPGSLLRGLWATASHWYLEVEHARLVNTEITAYGDIVQDGMSLSERFGYDEAFGFQLIEKAPFYFFKQDGKIGISYSGQTVQLGYTDVRHNLCCAGAEFNPIQSENMVAAFAQRDQIWFYVEVGVFETPNVASPVATSATLPPDVYLSPVLLSGQGAWTEGQLCPNPMGLWRLEQLPFDTAFEVIARFGSRDIETARRATDLAYWALLPFGAQLAEPLPKDRLSTPQPAKASPYADFLSAQCGKETMEMSWWIELCPESCQDAEIKSPALISHLFLINRQDHWLVWATYP